MNQVNSTHIYIAFRFHGNFYHSYRGDTPDELGFGKDIRIIRHIIKTLDEFNNRGIPVNGTWDFENYFSLEKIMPEYCPDIIENLQRRVKAGQDDIQLMSYNNGLVSAHTAKEFAETIRRAMSNDVGSGLHDLFGDNFQGMVRPQEMMFTPIHLKLYKAYGVNSVSLFYSALPFNGFSNFIPPLSLTERYNPLTLTYPGIEETMTLLPCYNTGDLADHLTLRRWVKNIRKEQLTLNNPQDLLLLIDMDADDEFWVGFDIPILKNILPTTRGLKGLIYNIADLDYIKFTTPDRYLKNHQPVSAITFGQDTADGSFDGYASWAEKWSNQQLWTGLERARILELQTHRLLEEKIPEIINNLLDESFDERLKILSTTHFGMSAPVMNVTREQTAIRMMERAIETANNAFQLAAKSNTSEGSFSLLDYCRGISTEEINYQAHASRGLIRLQLEAHNDQNMNIMDADGNIVPSTIIKTKPYQEIYFIENFEPNERKDYSISIKPDQSPTPIPFHTVTNKLENEFITISFDRNGHVTNAVFNGHPIGTESFLTSSVTFDKNRSFVESWEIKNFHSTNIIDYAHMNGVINIKGNHQIALEREILLADGLPYIYIRLKVNYPLTPSKGYNKGKAKRLQQTWDERWTEIIPCEIEPKFFGTPEKPLRVWKHNYCDHVSSFMLNYEQFSDNIELDSVNNHITHGWMSVSNGEKGLLVAQSADTLSSLAFCPIRTRNDGNQSSILLNPFGTYWGRQYSYKNTADTGLGNLAATKFSAADHIVPYAPSYNGRQQEFQIMLAPYTGDEPPLPLQHDAEAFAYPYLLLSDGKMISTPPHHRWNRFDSSLTPTI